MKKLLQIVLATILVIAGTFTMSINSANAQSASPFNVLLPLQEIAASQDQIAGLNDYQKRGLAIGINGSSYKPDQFLGFFTQRGLPFVSYVNNVAGSGVRIGSSQAYAKNVATLQEYIGKITNSEKAAVEATIKELESYKSKFLAIGLNGDTLQPDGFNSFFAGRNLNFEPFVRSASRASIGQPSAYDVNIATLGDYLSKFPK